MAVLNLTPMLPVDDIDAACAFMRDCLGFETTFRIDGHAYCESGAGAVRFINAAPGADLTDEARQMAIYIDVDNVDALYAAHQEALDALPSGQFRAPFDRPYGQRELHVIHGPHLFQVGHPVGKDGSA